MMTYADTLAGQPHHPTRGDTMPTPTPQPHSTAVALCDIPYFYGQMPPVVVRRSRSSVTPGLV
jgi:hypothetical protein